MELFIVYKDWSEKKPKLYSIPVNVSATGNSYSVKGKHPNRHAFGFRNRFKPGEHAECAEDAWKRFRDQQEDAIDRAKADLDEATQFLSVAEKQLKKFYE